MILQRLAEHYDRIVAEGSAKLAPPGYSSQRISFCICSIPMVPLTSLSRFSSRKARSIAHGSLSFLGRANHLGKESIHACFGTMPSTFLDTRRAQSVRKDLCVHLKHRVHRTCSSENRSSIRFWIQFVSFFGAGLRMRHASTLNWLKW